MPRVKGLSKSGRQSFFSSVLVCLYVTWNFNGNLMWSIPNRIFSRHLSGNSCWFNLFMVTILFNCTSKIVTGNCYHSILFLPAVQNSAGAICLLHAILQICTLTSIIRLASWRNAAALSQNTGIKGGHCKMSSLMNNAKLLSARDSVGRFLNFCFSSKCNMSSYTLALKPIFLQLTKSFFRSNLAIYRAWQ